jgi:hypothetical protein
MVTGCLLVKVYRLVHLFYGYTYFTFLRKVSVLNPTLAYGPRQVWQLFTSKIMSFPGLDTASHQLHRQEMHRRMTAKFSCASRLPNSRCRKVTQSPRRCEVYVRKQFFLQSGTRAHKSPHRCQFLTECYVNSRRYGRRCRSRTSHDRARTGGRSGRPAAMRRYRIQPRIMDEPPGDVFGNASLTTNECDFQTLAPGGGAAESYDLRRSLATQLARGYSSKHSQRTID